MPLFVGAAPEKAPALTGAGMKLEKDSAVFPESLSVLTSTESSTPGELSS